MALDRLTKIDGGGISTTSDYRVGIITARKFIGPFDGTGGNFTGVITATDGIFSGNVTIGGTLTYEDVTNIDSVGIITAQKDIHVGAGVSAVGVGTFGSLDIGGDIDVDGHTNLDNVSISGVTTAAGAIDLNADLDVDGHTNLDNVSVSGVSTFSSNINLPDNISVLFGTHDDGKIKHTGANLQIQETTGNIQITNYANDLDVDISSDDGSGGTTNYFKADGSTGESILYNYGNEKIKTTSTGVSITGNSVVSGNLTAVDGTFSGDLDVDGHTNLDNVSIAGITTGTIFKVPDATDAAGSTNHIAVGDNSDLKLYHDNNGDAYISNATGHLTIRNNTSGKIINLQPKSGANGVIARYEGAVELYWNGAKRFETGDTVNINSNHFEITSGQQLRFDNSNNNRSSEILNTGSSGNSTLAFKTNGGTRWTIDSSGNFIPGTAGAEIGSTSAMIGDVYIADNKRLYLGSSSDKSEIYNDGNDLFINHTEAGYLQLQGNYGVLLQRHNGTENLLRALSNGAVELFYDQSNHATAKLATTATGVSVHGEVAASQDYPITKPVLDFNFAAEKKLDSRIQFTRASIATFVDKKGIVRYVSDNQPRFDHHPTSGVSLGLLLEQQSINYQPYSVDMSQGANNNEVTVENNAAIAPDGTMSASKITGGTNQNTSQRLGWTTQGVASNSYTMWSIWLKSEETSCIIQIYSNTYTFGADVLTVELADGTMGGHSGDFGDGTFRYNLEKYPNKWWRLSWGGNGNAGGNSGGMYVAVVPALNSARAANTGSTGKVWYAWGLQEEVGTQAKFATSYIPTNGSAVTRAADRGTIDGDDFNDFFDRYQGAVVHEVSNAIQSWTGGGSGWEFNNDNYQYNVITNIGSGYSHNAYPGGYAVAHGESSDTGSNSMSQFAPNSATGNQGFNYGYYAGRYPSNSNVDYNRLYKTYTDGMSWDVTGSTNTLTSAVGGFSSTGTNTNVISYRNISKLEFGSDATDMDGSYQKFSGRIKRWMYYDKALTANQLRNLTAQDPVTYL